MLEREDIQVTIPARLDDVVGDSLRQVERLHRRKIVKRAGTALGSFAVAVGAVAVLGVTNPALASQLPVIGRLFATVNEDSKVYGPANLDSYDAVRTVEKTAVSTGDGKLTVVRAYSDGNSIELGLEMELPDSDRFQSLSADYGKNNQVSVNGENVETSMNFFTRSGENWLNTLHIVLPEELREQESYRVGLDLGGFTAMQAGEEIRLEQRFTTELTVFADAENAYAFTAEAEDNGAKVFAVSGTPTRTVISIEKPYWGEANPNNVNLSDYLTAPDCYPMGFPELYTEDGQEIQRDVRASDYDMYARETQRADLAFDGVPAGTKKLLLQWIHGDVSKDVVAEFVIDLENGAVTAGNGGIVIEKDFNILQGSVYAGSLADLEGYQVENLSFSHLHAAPQAHLVVISPAETADENLRITVTGKEGVVLLETTSILESGDWNWDEWWDSKPANQLVNLMKESGELEIVPSGIPTVYMVQVLEGFTEPAYGDTVTVTITDQNSGEVLSTQEIKMDNIS